MTTKNIDLTHAGNVPVFRPWLDDGEIDAATGSLRAGWLGMGASVGEFEAAVGAFLELDDERRVVAVSTGHAALHLAMLLIGAGPGDEIITPSFNNVADFQAIAAVGASPVFCDIDPDTLCIDLDKAAELVTPATKAIIIMDYDCCLADYAKAEALAQQHGLRIIHDAAHSFGSLSNGRKVGSFSDIAMFSFDPVKTITCIDGGALVVRSAEEARQLQEMRLIGMGQPAEVMYQNKRAWTYGVQRLGFRYHMANLHAAVGLAQLAKIDAISETRREACKLYNEILSPVEGVTVPKSDFEGITPFLYYIRVPEDARDDLRAHLLDRQVDTGIHWQPGHWFELFADARRGDLTVTEQVAREVLSLPLHSGMEEATVRHIANSVAEFFTGRAAA